jgi:hypothetical protein
MGCRAQSRTSRLLANYSKEPRIRDNGGHNHLLRLHLLLSARNISKGGSPSSGEATPLLRAQTREET